MFQPGSTPPTSASSPAPGSASDPLVDDLNSIVTQCQELMKSDQGSPDFLPVLSRLTREAKLSTTVKLRGENARIALEALDEAGFSFTMAKKRPGINPILYRPPAFYG